MEHKNRLDYIKLYASWEEKRNLFKWKLLGVNIWEYIRLGVFDIIDSKLVRVNYYEDYYYIKENSTKLHPRILKELPKRFLNKKDILFVNMSRRQEINNVYYSPYLDGLVNELNYSYYILEARARENRNIKIVTPNVLFYDPDNMGCKVKKNENIDLKINRFIEIIEHDFKINLTLNDRNSISKNIYSVVYNRKNFKLYYKLLLNIIRPKIIIIIGAALQYNRYLIEAAKEMDIPTVEYEHGFNNALSMDAYYSKLYDIGSTVDYRWTYGKAIIYSYKLPFKKERIVAVGNEFHNQRVRELINENIGIIEVNDKKNILFISDYTIISRLAELAVELSEIADAHKYRIIFKLHPGEIDWRDKYPCLLNSKVVVKGMDHKNDINYYILQSSCVVGTVSTALTEAVELKKKLYIYNKSIYSIGSEFLYKNGYATLFNDVNELIKLIEDDRPLLNLDNLYEKNPISNVNTEINKIIKIK